MRSILVQPALQAYEWDWELHHYHAFFAVYQVSGSGSVVWLSNESRSIQVVYEELSCSSCFLSALFFNGIQWRYMKLFERAEKLKHQAPDFREVQCLSQNRLIVAITSRFCRFLPFLHQVTPDSFHVLPCHWKPGNIFIGFRIEQWIQLEKHLSRPGLAKSHRILRLTHLLI